MTNSVSARKSTNKKSAKVNTANNSKENCTSVDDIIATLYSEHRYIHSLLESLTEQGAKLKPGKIPDYHLMLEMVDYLKHYPDQYHHPREDILFKSLLEHEKEFQKPLERLLREHKVLDYYTDKLFTELTDIVNGRPANRPMLLRRIERYIDGYIKHMHYESHEVFPLAKGTLSEEVLNELTEKTRHIDDPLFGSDVQQAYQRLGKKLRSDVESIGGEILAKEFALFESTIEYFSGFSKTMKNLKHSSHTITRRSIQEQMDTLKEHSHLIDDPNVIQLPKALIKNHWRHWREGIEDVKQLLKSEKKHR